ncbi:MAG: aminoacyl-tRNA hydrolase [Bacteroidia bacterium]|nr:aminoacyl-tRNA hydrolase [Bacteroidia bacterium]
MKPFINLYTELEFKTSRSSGKGGQNVNKVSTKVELNFDVVNSALLNITQKQTILKELCNKINKHGVLQIVVQSSRSQLQNKELAVEKFYTLLTKCFEVKKKRLTTAQKKSIKETRLQSKRKHSEKKALRKKWNE